MWSLHDIFAHWDITVTLVIFLITYAGIATGHWFYLKLDRAGIALLGAIAMLAFGCITLPQAVASVNMTSILLLFALMVIASQLHYAGFYNWLAEKISGDLLARPALFLAVLMGASGVLSAFLNNDVVVLAVAPVVAVSLLRKRMNPVPFLIALALASNIGCALTTIGNAQNVLVGEIAKLSFKHYMLFATLPVFLSLAAAFGIVYAIARRSFYLAPDTPVQEPSFAENDNVFSGEDMPLNVWRTVKGLGTLAIIVVLFVATDLPHYLVAMTGAGLLLCSRRLQSRDVLRGVNWQLIVLFIGLFVLIGALEASGLVEKIIALCRNGLIDTPVPLAAVTAVLSNCINNSAAVMLLVKVTDLANPLNGYSLALSNAFAGNFLIVGSLANIIAVQCADSLGIKIGFREFAKYGVPTATASMTILLIWLTVWS